MISFEDAQRLILSEAHSFGTDEIDLEEADGRILAEPVAADRDYPPFNRAMMDGYAIMLSDWNAGIRTFRVLETIFPAAAPRLQISSGCCYKIMTGSAVPFTADVIIRREDAREQEKVVELQAETLQPFQNIARKGEDLQNNSPVLAPLTICEPPVISLLAALGKHRIQVLKLPSVAVITTGDEVVSPNEQVSDLQIRNSNQFLLKSLLKKWGIRPAICAHVRDDQPQLKEILGSALKNDIIIINGAVSAGDADYVPGTLDALHVKKLFHAVAMKPGKPLWCGVAEGGGMVFALPGNPLSCLTTFTTFIEPYLRKCLSMEKPALRVPLLQSRAKKSLLTEFFPVKLIESGAQAIQFNSSGDVTAAIKADGLAMHPAEAREMDAGAASTVYPFNRYHT